MDREWLAAQLRAGRSIEDIAREAGRNPSTVAYWVNKHGLVSSHAARHRSRGGIPRGVLAPLVESGMTHRRIASELGVSVSTVRHWLKRHGLRTAGVRGRGAEADMEIRECDRHGLTEFVRYRPHDHFRCLACRKQRVADRRRDVKRTLVLEAGGRCELCGYSRHLGALQFHHRDPAEKRFGLSQAGVARGIERCREEASKCALLCANCHAEVEAGVATLPVATEPHPG